MTPLEQNHVQRLKRREYAFQYTAAAAVTTIPATFLGMSALMMTGAWHALHTFGFGFFTSASWNPVTQKFGALTPILGTLESSAVAMAIATPLALCAAIFVTESCPAQLRKTAAIAFDLLAAVPSVVYGLLGLTYLVPHMGSNVLTASLILSLMVLPSIAASFRESLDLVPPRLKEAIYHAGLTTREGLVDVKLPHVLPGFIGGVMLGLGRALGETMAVSYLIGNSHRLTHSLLDPATSITATIASEFNESSGELYGSSIMALAATLMGISLGFNIISHALTSRLNHEKRLTPEAASPERIHRRIISHAKHLLSFNH